MDRKEEARTEDKRPFIHKDWACGYDPSAPVTGRWRALRYGVGMCAGLRREIISMIDNRDPAPDDVGKPRKGSRITYKGREVGTVDHLDGNLCWVNYDDGTRNPFIWRFRDGLNAMHDWPGKSGPLAPCPGYDAGKQG